MSKKHSSHFGNQRKFTHGQILPIEILPSVINGLKAIADRNETSLFHEIRCAIYQYLDRELQPNAFDDPNLNEDIRAMPEPSL